MLQKIIEYACIKYKFIKTQNIDINKIILANDFKILHKMFKIWCKLNYEKKDTMPDNWKLTNPDGFNNFIKDFEILFK